MFLTEAEAIARASSFTKPLILYHADCLDGWTACFLALKRYGADCPHIAIPPGNEPFSEEVLDASHGRNVLILDASRPPNILASIQDQGTLGDARILVLDHHESNRKDHEPWARSPVMFFDNNRSGAGLALDVFFPWARPSLAPFNHLEWWSDHMIVRQDRGIVIDQALIALAVEDRDLWRFKLENTKAICASLWLYEKTYDEWESISQNVGSREDEGRVILLAQDAQVEQIAKTADTLQLQEGAILVCNTSILQSEVGEALNKIAPAPLKTALLWYIDADGSLKGSFRSAPDGANVANIARRFGGGGHAHAAGFRIPDARSWVMGLLVSRAR